MLVCINPKAKDMQQECGLSCLGELIYSNNGCAVLENGTLRIPAESASMYLLPAED